MASLIPVPVISEVIGKRISGCFKSGTHINNCHSGCGKSIDESPMHAGSLRAASRLADP
jgi:hypothetical protein